MKINHLNQVGFFLTFFLFFVLIFESVQANILMKANQIKVSTSAELNAAIASAKPADVIIMKDGTWKDIDIKFNAKASQGNPIILRAETPGKVILAGASKLTFAAPYLITEGILFTKGTISKGAVVTFTSDYCQLKNTAIIDYNPADFDTEYFWVNFKGNSNTVDHCKFQGKTNTGPLVCNNETDSRYNKVTYCYFKDIPLKEKSNGREIIKVVGYGHSDQPGGDGAFFTIEHNLFEHADGEGVEIVSLKSNHNLVRYNTVTASCGGLVNRRGSYNTFEGNFIFGENKARTLGIRIANENNMVINNYISDVVEGGIILMTGEYLDKELTKNYDGTKRLKSGKMVREPSYGQVRNCLFENNTLVNIVGSGIIIGGSYKKDWSNKQIVLLPELNHFKNNTMVNCSKSIETIIQDKNPPIDFLTFKPNVFEGNKPDEKISNIVNPYSEEFKNNKDYVERHPLTFKEVGTDWGN